MSNKRTLEEYVVEIGRGITYPPTPRFQVVPTAAPTRPHALPRLALLVVLAALLALLFAPPVRARLFEILRLGGMEIQIEPAGESSATEIPFAAIDLISGLELDGRTTLAEARQNLDFAIALPAYPPDLGEPDAVYVQNIGTGPFVVLVWVQAARPSEVRYVIYVLGRGTVLSKGPLNVFQGTEVGESTAIWTEGSYIVDIGGRDQDVRLVEGYALIWTQGELTYRLEGATTIEEAVRIAESIE